jgi:hypothetical protein
MVVVVADGEPHEFPDATRFSTEERFNNLCIWAGKDADVLVAVFADGRWEQVHHESS